MRRRTEGRAKRVTGLRIVSRMLEGGGERERERGWMQFPAVCSSCGNWWFRSLLEVLCLRGKCIWIVRALSGRFAHYLAMGMMSEMYQLQRKRFLLGRFLGWSVLFPFFVLHDSVWGRMFFIVLL